MSSASNQQSSPEKALLTVRVDRDTLDRVKEYARRTDTTVSQIVRDFFQHLLVEAKRPTEGEVEQL
jgi:antitoxin component of RelBE/YafQ-DinJ toxin-antitoxin module